MPALSPAALDALKVAQSTATATTVDLDVQVPGADVAMARTRRTPAPAPHEPAGDFRQPAREQGLVCTCGAALTRVPNSATDPRHLDWTEVDEQGRTWIDITPTFRYRVERGLFVDEVVIDMHDADAWDRLAQVDIGKYSMLKVAYDMGFPFSHVHRAATRPEDLALSIEELRARSKNPPECHGRPMWAAPDGWRCRTTYGEPALVPYAQVAAA